MKKILIVSNNPLSYTQHNSKTILSLVDNKLDFSLAQLFFSSGTPSYHHCKYYRISDSQLVQSIKKWSIKAGEPVIASSEQCSDNPSSKVNPSNYFMRLCREVIWKIGSIDYERLFRWINDFSPDILLFMAGDCVFAYDIVAKILKHRTNMKNIVYVTDDYILPRMSLSMPFWIRRNMLLKRMRSCIARADLFITISPKMQHIYRTLFLKDSIVYANTPTYRSGIQNELSAKRKENKIVLTYMGGLHYNRWKSLSLLAKAIHAYNTTHSKKAILQIYSATKMTKKMLKALNIDGASMYCGHISSDSIMEIMMQSDINVHVESFDKRSTAATRLSFSTKIYECLSAGKCVLAIGPSDIASMEYLADCAECIYKAEEINEKLIERLFISDYRDTIAKKCYKKYLTDCVISNPRMEIVEIIKSI